MGFTRTIFLLSAFSLNCSFSKSKILAVFPFPAHSHYTVNAKLVKELANRGYEITYITPYPGKLIHKNIKDISTESMIDIINGEYFKIL